MTTEQKAKAWDLLHEANLNIEKGGGLFSIFFGDHTSELAKMVLSAMKDVESFVREHH